MNNIYKNISRIEDFFYTLLYEKVSNNIYPNNLPISIDKSWKEIVVIDAGAAIRDMDAYGFGTILIYLYARPLDNGIKDVATMNVMETALVECINSSAHPHYVVRRGSTYSDYDEGRNLHCNIYEINLTIV